MKVAVVFTSITCCLSISYVLIVLYRYTLIQSYIRTVGPVRTHRQYSRVIIYIMGPKINGTLFSTGPMLSDKLNSSGLCSVYLVQFI
jgi:hypothetical protein